MVPSTLRDLLSSKNGCSRNENEGKAIALFEYRVNSCKEAVHW
jgi:hypothetical protein